MSALAGNRRKVLPVKGRSLLLEPLEERALLDAAPWQNPVYPMDVNNSSTTTPTDLLIEINRFLAGGGVGEVLPDPGPDPVPYYYDPTGDNQLTITDISAIINTILSPPQVVVSSLTPYTADVTPQITVTVSETSKIADGAVLDLDVDLNDDGDFNDPGERGHTQSTFFGGSSTFPITPGLERTSQPYFVNLRARVKDSRGVPGTSPVLPLGVDTGTSTALEDYVNAFDPSYTYSLVGNVGKSYFLLDMVSQTWRSTADVNLPVWHHWLEIYVPTGPVFFDTALLLIDGGGNGPEPPDPSAELAQVAELTHSVVVQLTTVPNEPVIFTGETFSRTEDAIIAYTFDKYMDHLGEPGNETWPLLLPMVKSAVRAMDTAQAFVPAVLDGLPINDFVVFGGSKRGWTTWLTAAVDDRVRAIMPGVIDVLNTGPQMVHHYGAYGFFSYAIQDYEELRVFDRLLTPEGRELFRIVDPYSYLTNGRFDDMPKLLVNSSGDQFFVSDSAQFYYDDIPGDLNRLRYVPNTDHGLNVSAILQSVASFYGSVLGGQEIPDYSWTVAQDGSIHVQTSDAPFQVLLWQATNPETRDFRRPIHPEITWTPTPLVDQGGGTYVGDVPIPDDGATAYFIELTFPSAFPGFPFVFTTEIRVKTNLPLYPWPFDTPEVTVSTLTPFTADVTPQVTVTTPGAPAIDDGTVVNLDVDLNGDGDFSDPGELGYMQSTVFNGSSTFQIAPALERRNEAYTVNLRARVKNFIGLEGISPIVPLEIDTLTSSALEDYVNAPDDSYTYSVVSTEVDAAYTYYVLSMTSQTWRSTADVDDPVWDHWIGVYVPNGPIVDTAMMLIDGGHNTDGPPSNSAADLGLISAVSGTVVFDLKIVPNEPVTFTDETDSRSEDGIIAYTFDKFLEHLGEPGNETWPLLLPMVKSAVRAMDTIQDFIPGVKEGAPINDFVVSGFSKRGWTTWLTAAVDDRVKAIAPGVIDVLNLGPQMVHHYGAYGFFSEAIGDYEALNIFERLLTREGQELGRIVDPYSYLYNGRFDDMPKLLLNSAGDEFFVTDSAQFYYDDIPGELNRLRYFPNTGHGLDEPEVVKSLVSFYGSLLLDLPMPEYSWTVEQDGSIHAQTSASPTQVLLWQATNPVSRDFRHLLTGDIWTSTPLTDQGGGTYVGDVSMPATGATAYLIEFTFDSPIPGYPYVFTTEVRVKSPLPLVDWPFEVDPLAPAPASAPMAEVASMAAPVPSDDPTRAAAATALAIQSLTSSADDEAAPYEPLLLADDEPAGQTLTSSATGLMVPEAPAEETDDGETDAQAVDCLFDSSLVDSLN